ncbi:hypothetical protein GW17_00022509 [Ensete ventricosum]|nr:hypothetical protein GW17_00022509 [Ensete ventricosum]
MYGEAPSRVTEPRPSTDDSGLGSSKLMRYPTVFATGRSIHAEAAEVVEDAKRMIPGGPDPQHHSRNP